jgi:hypothetical protein
VRDMGVAERLRMARDVLASLNRMLRQAKAA